MSVVTRIAPSPTGFLHFGLARTALFSYLYARKHGGTYIVRIEDTDKARNKKEYEEDIFEQLRWLHLEADKVYVQSEHLERHKECLHQLIASDKAYVSKEPAKDDPSRTVEVVRLRNPGEVVTFTDAVRGEISFDTAELGDFVVARSTEDPLYHLAVVIDDHDEGVTHVIRGDDHISNTPRQILILRALGFDIPQYAHLPLILMPDKSKMSKRKHETAVRHFREAGFLHDAMLNYLAHLGWTPPSGKEFLSLEEMTAEFDLESLHKAGAVFDIEKLRWYNREYLLLLPEQTFKEQALHVLHEAIALRSLPWDATVANKLTGGVIRERTHTWYDIRTLAAEGELDYFFADPSPDANSIPHKGGSKETAAANLEHVRALLQEAPAEAFANADAVKAVIWDFADSAGRGEVLWPLRFSLSGRSKSPDPFTIISIIGKDATLRRIDTAILAVRSS